MWYDIGLKLYDDWSTLLNLGKVNVICGKNNSGKSTILKTLSDKKNYQKSYHLKFPLLEEILNQLEYPEGVEQFDESGEFDGWNGLNPNIAEAFSSSKECLIKLSEVEPNETYGNIKILKEKIKTVKESITYVPVDFFQGNETGEYIEEFDFRGVDKVFKDYQELLESTQKTLFIETQREINPNQGYLDVKGILKELFIAKNSRSSNTNKFRKFTELETVFNEISNGYYFSVDVKQIADFGQVVLYFSKNGTDWYEAANSGLGLRALLLLLYSSILSEANIILIDEPESYLHPSWQRALLRYFQKKSGKQYIIASHSNIFLDTNYVDRIFQTKYTTKIEVSDILEKTFALHDLGYLTIDNLQGDLLILVEGKTDVAVLEEMLKTLGYWDSYDIKILPCGGVSGVESMPLETFKSDYNTVMLLIDGDWCIDKGLKKAKNRIDANCKKLELNFHTLKGYGVENYFNLRVLREFKGTKHPLSHNELNSDKTAPKLKCKIKKITAIANKNVTDFKEIASKMTKEEIEATGDLYEFIEEVIKVCNDSLPKK